ncbi:hypothetical protein VTP01DRAFT_4686 [Rhizomucor pusillus]|uniref:uncharacterized protein n=1 Tax=Rhizomucor pusillus TaxID=4840 RepID=UPI0037420F09
MLPAINTSWQTERSGQREQLQCNWTRPPFRFEPCGAVSIVLILSLYLAEADLGTCVNPALPKEPAVT